MPPGRLPEIAGVWSGTPLRLTVLVPAYNEALTIAATLESLWGQTRPPDRVVVVADNCSDDTADIARAHGADVFTTVGNTEKKAGRAQSGAVGDLPRHQRPRRRDGDGRRLGDRAGVSRDGDGSTRERSRSDRGGRRVLRRARLGPGGPAAAQRVHPLSARDLPSEGQGLRPDRHGVVVPRLCVEGGRRLSRDSYFPAIPARSTTRWR